jgi:hypothetical protein
MKVKEVKRCHCCGAWMYRWYKTCGEGIETMSIETEKGRILKSVLLEFKRRGDLLRDVACSGVEFDGHRDYVVVQIDRDIWEKLERYRIQGETECNSKTT